VAVDHRSPLEIPILETERLRLRGHTLADFAHTGPMWRDDSVMVYMGGRPLTLEESWTRFLRYAGHWVVLGFGYWVIQEKATGDFVGEIGLGDFKRDLEPSLHGVPELGWVLTPAKHGRGYATEAAKAVLRWGREHFGPSEFSCIIHPEHRASLNVAKKCGFVPEGSGDYKGRPTTILKLTL
jgi:RimJ/RimL family protein N-acetyltransferase